MKYKFNKTQDEISLEKKIKLLLYRSVKELQCNISKNAKARSIEIKIITKAGLVELTVIDDGIDFDTTILDNYNNKKKSFGLFSIKQRLTNIGGSFNIVSKKRKGTEVNSRVPLSI